MFWTFGVGVVACVVVGFVALWKANGIARPIVAASKFAQTIADGELTKDCAVKATAEAGELITAMNRMRVSLSEMVGRLGATPARSRNRRKASRRRRPNWPPAPTKPRTSPPPSPPPPRKCRRT